MKCNTRVTEKTAYLQAGIIAVFFFIVDQCCKYLAQSQPHTRIPLFTPYLSWEYFQNFGIAFSVPLPSSITVSITPIIIVMIASYMLQTRADRLTVFGSFLIISGAISNFIDRFLFGYTIDYIRIFNAIINIADIAIVLGGILLIRTLYTTKESKTEIFSWE